MTVNPERVFSHNDTLITVLNPLPVNIVSGGGSVTVLDIQDGAGDSVMDIVNDAIRVNIVAGGGSGGTALADQTTFTEGITSFTPIGGEFNDSPSDPSAGEAAAARITAKRALHVNLRDDSGTEIGTASDPIRIDPTGSTAQPVTDNGGSLTVDGTVSISGTVTVSQTNLATADYDTGAGTVTQAMIGIALPASGGPVAGGTNTNPVQVGDAGTTLSVDDGGGSLTVDGTVAVSSVGGTVTVSGTVTADQGTSPWLTAGSQDSNVTGTLSASGQSVTISCAGKSHISFYLDTTTWVTSGNVFIEASPNGSDWWLVASYAEIFAGINYHWTPGQIGGFQEIISVPVRSAQKMRITSAGTWTGGETIDVTIADSSSVSSVEVGSLVNLIWTGSVATAVVSADHADNSPGVEVPASGTMGWDASNTVWRRTAITSTGQLEVFASGTVAVSSVGGTVTVSGTVTANAGTGTFTVDQVDTASLDYDTGVGTVNQTVIGIALPGSGGPVAGGTSSNPVRIDPTGTTTQPVSGTITTTPATGTLTDHSGTITTGGSAQSLMGSNSNRKYLVIQNTGNKDLWFNFTTTAVQDQPSFKLPPNGAFVMENSFVSTEAISIIGPTTGKSFTAKEG